MKNLDINTFIINKLIDKKIQSRFKLNSYFIKMESKKRKRDAGDDDDTMVNIIRKRPFISFPGFSIDKIIWDSKLLDYIRNCILVQEKEDVHKWIAHSIQENIYSREDIQYMIVCLLSLLIQFLPDLKNEKYIITHYYELIESIKDNELLNSIKIKLKYDEFIRNMELIDSGKNRNLTRVQNKIRDYYDEQAQNYDDIRLEARKEFKEEQEKQDKEKHTIKK